MRDADRPPPLPLKDFNSSERRQSSRRPSTASSEDYGQPRSRSSFSAPRSSFSPSQQRSLSQSPQLYRLSPQKNLPLVPFPDRARQSIASWRSSMSSLGNLLPRRSFAAAAGPPPRNVFEFAPVEPDPHFANCDDLSDSDSDEDRDAGLDGLASTSAPTSGLRDIRNRKMPKKLPRRVPSCWWYRDLMKRAVNR